MQTIPSAIDGFKITPLSDRSVLLSFGNIIDPAINERVLVLHKALSQSPFEGFVESVPAYASLAVFYDVKKIRIHTSSTAFAYVKKHLQVKIDGKPVILEFVGYEVEGASLWSYYQVNNINTVRKIDIADNLLYEFDATQISIVHAQVGGNKKSTRVTNPESAISFEF